MKKEIDLTDYREIQEPSKTKTIYSCSIRLDRNTMLEILQSEIIKINGEYFKIPELTLLQCLLNKRYGEIKLDLEKIKLK